MMELKVVTVISVIFTINGCNGQVRTADTDNDPRPKTAFGYPVDRAYRVDNRGPQRFAPVTEESSREQQYFNEQDSQRGDSEQHTQQPLFTPQQQQQQASLQQYYQQQQLQQQQQQAALQQYYQSLAQLQDQRQQADQQQDQQPLQVQVPVAYRSQGHQQLRPPVKQPLQQQRDATTDPISSSVSFLGVRYSAAPAVAHTMFRTNTGVSFSY